MNQSTVDRNESGGGRTTGRTARWVAAAAVALIAIGVVTWALGQGTEDLPPDFAMVAYQGFGGAEGDEVQFHDLVGQGTPMVLNFWAASCPPCREEMPNFQQVADEFGDEILIVGVDIGAFTFLGTHEEARALLDAYDIRYPAAYAVDGQVVRDYQVRGMPTTLFFDGAGRTVDKHTGFLPLPEFRDQVEALVVGGS